MANGEAEFLLAGCLIPTTPGDSSLRRPNSPIQPVLQQYSGSFRAGSSREPVIKDGFTRKPPFSAILRHTDQEEISLSASTRIYHLVEALEATQEQHKPTSPSACCVPYVIQQTRRFLSVVQERRSSQESIHEMWRTLECLLSELLVMTSEYCNASTEADSPDEDPWKDCEDIKEKDLTEWLCAQFDVMQTRRNSFEGKCCEDGFGKQQDCEDGMSACSTMTKLTDVASFPSSASSLPPPSSASLSSLDATRASIDYTTGLPLLPPVPSGETLLPEPLSVICHSARSSPRSDSSEEVLTPTQQMLKTVMASAMMRT